MIYGVSVAGWWMAEISGNVPSINNRHRSDCPHERRRIHFTSFIDGARDLLGVALIIGIARGIVVIMDRGMITDTILFAAESTVTGSVFYRVHQRNVPG